MKHIFLSLAVCLVATANAQSYNWKFVDVKNAGVTVGHIYHTESVGRQTGATPEKVPTGLRLVCTVTGSTVQEAAPPLLVLYWNGMSGNIPENVTVKVDNKQIGVGQPYIWKHDGPVLYRTVAESGEILRAIKTGRTVTMSWTGSNGYQRTTMFDIKTFNQNIDDFNTACKTNI